MNETAIVIDKLTKKFEDVAAVDGLSLEVEKGELFGLLGSNARARASSPTILLDLSVVSISSVLALLSGILLFRKYGKT